MEVTFKEIESRLQDGRLEKLHPKVWVYRKAIKDPDVLMAKLLELPDWKDWWVFGVINDELSGANESWDDFPTRDEWEQHLQIRKKSKYPELILEIEEYFYSATRAYTEEQGIDLENWVHQTPSVCLYKSGGGVGDGLTMNYHTDDQQEKSEARGDKFRVTCTMYLNDDYEGGELSFIIKDDSGDTRFDYKPQAGDILVFPSTHPFYHGVKEMITGDRFFIRNFWLEYFPGTPDWLAGEAKYGEEIWAKMEKERELAFIKSSTSIG